jgi:serine/threonine-protein kinase
MKKMFRWSMILVLLVVIGAGVTVIHTIFWGGTDEAVPPMRGSSVIDAVAQIEKMGLEVRVEQVLSTFPAGTVLSQWPDPGTRVGRNKVVILKVSKGGHKTSLPDVRGLEKDQAIQKLESLGFTIGDQLEINDSSKPRGVVLAQSPSAPAMVGKGQKVDLMISQGPAVAGGKVSVPDVLQMQEQVAKKLLLESGLKIARVDHVLTIHTPEGMVMGLSPKAGTIVDSGTAVTIKVAKEGTPEPKPVKPAKQEKPAVTVSMPGMGSNASASNIKKVEQKPAPVKPAEQVPSSSESPGTPAVKPESPQVTTVTPPSVPAQTAKIRYQVPPLTKPMQLKIEMIDVSGTRVVLDKSVKGGEYISMNEKYGQEAVVTIYLGGEFVWQEKYR